MPSPRTSAFAALLLAVCFIGLGRGLWTPDEPREAEISREMSLSPTVVPTLDGEVFIEKPPLYYWTVASVFALTGKPPPQPPARSVQRPASSLCSWFSFGDDVTSRRKSAWPQPSPSQQACSSWFRRTGC
jgi:4-amino-4-deoxy-L-arabinose transferase-like glycosyltransferase